jgi:hypothetical protein
MSSCSCAGWLITGTVIDKGEEEEVQETPEQENSAEPEVDTRPISDEDWLRSNSSSRCGDSSPDAEGGETALVGAVVAATAFC